MVHQDRIEERLSVLIMDALDGEISRQDRRELEELLVDRPDMAREWAMMQTIDTLFRETPLLQPTTDFAQRTVARLPSRRARVWAVGTLFLFILVSGALPLAVVAWLGSNYGAALSEPAVLGGVGQVFGTIGALLQVVTNGLWRLLTAFGEQMVQNPVIWGWMAVMIGMVLLWSGVYGRLLRQPGRAYISNR